MRLSINPVTVAIGDDEVDCYEANVYVAVSDSVAVRVVPVRPDGTEFPDAAVGIVGTGDQPDIAAFLSAVSSAAGLLLAARGV